MDPVYFRDRLAAGGAAIGALVSGIPDGLAGRRPAPDRWSILEIVCHLRDEEREDFRLRIGFTLDRPGEPWPGIDPVGWVSARRYAETDFATALADFQAERRASLDWLANLGTRDWSRAYEHPKLGRMTAGDLLASWACHDLLHLRQLSGVMFALTGTEAEPHRTFYAGSW